MAKVYATPGVYIEEKSAFPNSAVPVATAVPAFIGYTEKAILNKKDITHVPTRISSLGEYLLYFGGGPKTLYDVKPNRDTVYSLSTGPRFLLFQCLRTFFANGGSDCYIVSIGNYENGIKSDDFDNETTENGETKLWGIKALLKEPEPTMVVIPDAMSLGQDACYSLQQTMLKHCGEAMRSRFAILDVYDGFKKRTPDDTDVIKKFREGVGMNNMQWGGAYYPWVHTTITTAESVDFTNVNPGTNPALIAILKKEVEEAVKAKVLDPARAQSIVETIAKIDQYNPAPVALADAKTAETTAETELTTAKTEENNAKQAFDQAEAKDKPIKKVAWEREKGELAMAEIKLAVAKAVRLASEIEPLQKAIQTAKEIEIETKAVAAANTDKTTADTAVTTATAEGKAAALAAAALADAVLKLALSEAAKTEATSKATAAAAAATAAKTDPTKQAAADTASAGAQTAQNTAAAAEVAAEDAKQNAIAVAVKNATAAYDAAVAAAETDASLIKTQHQTLTAVSPMYKSIMSSLREQINLLPPSAAMAGVYSMVDNNIGVFQSPANVSVGSVVRPAVNLTNDEQEDLNIPLNGKAVNAIRTFPGKGVLVWGARTLDGNSQDWRYISVRRTVIFIEQSIKYATEPYVFQPNTAATWTNVKAMITNFLTNVWSQGALAGATAQDAFSVHIGLGETMTPVDILDGYMRITVKLAVTRPAEFIVITFEQQMQKS